MPALLLAYGRDHSYKGGRAGAVSDAQRVTHPGAQVPAWELPGYDAEPVETCTAGSAEGN